MKLMKGLWIGASVLPVLLLSVTLANAQIRADAYFGLGTAHDSSNGQLVDLLGTGNTEPTSSLGGVFGTFGGGLMLTPSLGVGAEVSFRFAQGDYAGLGYRPIFYDFNGIWMPTIISTKRIKPEVQAGFGGVSLRFYGGGAQYCDPYSGICSNFLGSSNHLQLHLGLGLRFYVTEHIFVRPQFDYHWVRNFTEFGSNSVPEYSMAVGYSF